ncbi:MAG: hypothetical protein LBS69_02195 [Prevotellaceae bacterium]|nr:hypothetical protein [Prevotellaceae bacterium]
MHVARVADSFSCHRNASRENIGGNYLSTDILSLTGHFYLQLFCLV